MNDKIRIEITQGALNNSYMRVGPYSNFFPHDSFGEPSADQGRGKLLKLYVEGLAYPVETDIATDKKIFRERGWCADFYRLFALKPGDEILIERLSDYEYRVSSKKTNSR